MWHFRTSSTSLGNALPVRQLHAAASRAPVGRQRDSTGCLPVLLRSGRTILWTWCNVIGISGQFCEILWQEPTPCQVWINWGLSKLIVDNYREDRLLNQTEGTGFLRLRDIIGPTGPIPVSKSTWWQGVKDGRYPKSLKLGPRITVWRAEEIRALIATGVPPHGE